LLTTEDTENTEVKKIPEEYTSITEGVIGAAIEVHRTLGPGLLESCYGACLAYELSKRGISFRKEVDLPIAYKEVKLDCGYRIDFVVADSILLELKSVDQVINVHISQTLTYMKLSGLRVGLLLNFNVSLMRDGITRLAL
jgi:GxxExxY protein